MRKKLNHCNGYTLGLESGNLAMVVEAECGCWKCDHCRPKLQDKWLMRALRAFPLSPLWEVVVCTEAQFQALSRRLRKTGKAYFRIRLPGENYVFHQPIVSNRQYSADPSKWINSAQVAELFESVLRRDDVLRPSCSVCFQFPEPVKPKSKWTRVVITKESVSDWNSRLKKLFVNAVLIHANPFDRKLLDVVLLRNFDPSIPLSRPGLSISSTPASNDSNTLIMHPTQGEESMDRNRILTG